MRDNLIGQVMLHGFRLISQAAFRLFIVVAVAYFLNRLHGRPETVIVPVLGLIFTEIKSQSLTRAAKETLSLPAKERLAHWNAPGLPKFDPSAVEPLIDIFFIATVNFLFLYVLLMALLH